MTQRHRRSARGFTMVELVVVIAIGLVLVGIALIRIEAPLTTMRANAGVNTVQSQLRTARDLAVSSRHDVNITFTAPNQIQIIEIARAGEPAANLTVFPAATLPNGVQFVYFPATGDTPDGFGTAPTGIAFGGAATQTFLSDGTFVDPAGQPLNGTLFVGMPGQPNTARAVTVLGATGRLRIWRWIGSWME